MNTEFSSEDSLLVDAQAAVAELYSAAALSMPWLEDKDIGHGHPVMVMPGFLCGDQFTALMKYFLGCRGFSVYGWELSPTDGFLNEATMLNLRAHLRSQYDRYHRKVSILAWGAGRAYVQDLAGNCSGCIRQVLVLESCIGTEERKVNYRYHPLPAAERLDNWHDRTLRTICPSEVQMTSIFNEVDRSVSWQCTNGESGSSKENIEKFDGRCGRMFSPGTLDAIVRCLVKAPDSHMTPS